MSIEMANASKLFFIDLDDKIESVIFTLFPNKVDEDGKIIEASFFFVSLSGEFIDGYKIEEGKFSRRYILNEKVVSKASFFMFFQEKDCDPFWCDGGTGGQLDTVVVTANTGNGTGANGINLFGNGNYYVGSGGDSNSSGYQPNDADLKTYEGTNRITGVAGTIYTHAIKEKRLAEGETECPDGYINNNGVCEIEFKVDDSQLTGKAKCIYDKLTQSNSNLFKVTIGQFIDDPKYNLTLTIGQCSTSDDACTNTANLATTGEIIIKIEDNNANPLQMAQYILHEAIHAELYRFVSRYESGVDPNNRPRLFQLFKYYNELYNIGDIQHIYMTEKYITPIASTLRKLDGSKYPLDYYKAFAWDGLRVWDAGNLLNVEMDSKYEDYRKTVIKNTTITCD